MNDWQVHPNVALTIRLLEAAGHVVVPREPTEEMCDLYDVPSHIARKVWHEMIVKAPRPWAEEKTNG